VAATPSVTIEVPGGRDVVISPSLGGEVKVYFSLTNEFDDRTDVAWPARPPFTNAALETVTVTAGTAVAVPTPDLGPGVTWHVKVYPPTTGETSICTGDGRS
jgi:hypothetical protein